jgi:Gpi18-like mannosyltransferase
MAALQGWRIILLINIASIGLLSAGILAGQALPSGLHTHGPGIDGQMLAWDGTWYQNIAQRGYQWNAAFGTTLGQHQNIAFFPLYALTDWASMHIAGSARPIFDILPGLGFGLCANATFYRLAEHLTPQPAFATALFAFWPASCFYAMGYPTGLLNLCIILCFLEYTGGRRWRAGF